jgi:hypothetical protein
MNPAPIVAFVLGVMFGALTATVVFGMLGLLR